MGQFCRVPKKLVRRVESNFQFCDYFVKCRLLKWLYLYVIKMLYQNKFRFNLKQKVKILMSKCKEGDA